MPRRNTQLLSVFVWQGLLILLPVVGLAAFGLLSLQKDRRLAEQEAKARAQELTEELAQKMAESFSPGSPNGLGAENSASPPAGLAEIDSAGRLLFPASYEPGPEPAPMEIPPFAEAQRSLFHKAQQTEFHDGKIGEALAAYRQLAAQKPPQPLLSAARFHAALACLKLGRAPEAAEDLLAVAGAPDNFLESGLPLQPLASLKLLELANGALPKLDLPAELICSNAVRHPTYLAAQTLAQCAAWEKARGGGQSNAALRWTRTWESEERSRVFYQIAFAQVIEPGNPFLAFLPKRIPPGDNPALSSPLERFRVALPPRFWIKAPDDVLAVCQKAGDGTRLRFHTEGQVTESLRRAALPVKLPPYFQAVARFGGHELPPLRAPAASIDRPSETRPFAKARQAMPGGDFLEVELSLSDPAGLYARQAERTRWFGALIALSACAALVGVANSYRQWRRQILLGEMKSNFVSSISHELRAPVASVRLMAEGLESGRVRESERQQEYFHHIVRECRRLSSLIENLLDFSRIEQRRKEYEFEPTDLALLMDQTLKVMGPVAAEAKVALKCALPSGLSEPAVLDGAAIQQALINLIDNAIKHSPAGAAVEVALEVARDRILFSVRDEGPGIPPNERRKIFERFYRLGSELRRETPGVGIGLSIVKHIVEAHGGHVSVEGEPGQGSCFRIEIPNRAQPPA